MGAQLNTPPGTPLTALYRIEGSKDRGPLIGSLLYRETVVSRTADVIFSIPGN